MTVKIHKFNKDTLSHTASINVNMSNTSGMTISHYVDSLKSSESTIPYYIEGMERHIPQISEVEFPAVVRKKVDFTAIGPNEKEITNIGEDIGKCNHKDKVPKRPLDLPPGFKEIYKS